MWIFRAFAWSHPAGDYAIVGRVTVLHVAVDLYHLEVESDCQITVFSGPHILSCFLVRKDYLWETDLRLSPDLVLVKRQPNHGRLAVQIAANHEPTYVEVFDANVDQRLQHFEAGVVRQLVFGRGWLVAGDDPHISNVWAVGDVEYLRCSICVMAGKVPPQGVLLHRHLSAEYTDDFL